MAKDNIIGKGIVFPVQLSNLGVPVISTGTELVESSIKVILGWPYRDRFFMGNFGSRLHELLEEQNGELLEAMIEYFIFDALRTWEPRIKIEDTQILTNGQEKVDVLVSYVIIRSQVRESFVYPFYKHRLI